VDKLKDIGIFGGTFSPPHLGHYQLAVEAKKEFNLDKVFFVPAYIPPHKEPRNVMDAEHRLEMVKLLINGNPDFILSDFEINRKRVSYSIDTLKHFKKEYPETKIHFLIGSDAFYHIDTWKDNQEVLKLTDFIIFPRAGNTKEMITKKFGNFANVVYWAHTGLIHIASTDIRFRIKSGEDCEKELGVKVSNYIKEHKLYK